MAPGEPHVRFQGNCGHWGIFERGGSVANDPQRLGFVLGLPVD